MSTGWKIVIVVAGALTAAALLVGAFVLGMRFGGAHPFRAAIFGVGEAPSLSASASPAGHGLFGTVEGVDLTARAIEVRSEQGARIVVSIGDDTFLDRRGQPIDLAMVRPGDLIVAIGAPVEAGRIAARAVRVLDTRPGAHAPLWSAVARGVYRIYRSIALVLRGLLGR